MLDLGKILGFVISFICSTHLLSILTFITDFTWNYYLAIFLSSFYFGSIHSENRVCAVILFVDELVFRSFGNYQTTPFPSDSIL